MCTKKRIIAIILLSVLFVIPMDFTDTKQNYSRFNREMKSADWIAPQLIPDPELEETPTFQINGSSEEFSYSHNSVDDYVNLTWRHTAGSLLNFKDVPLEPNSAPPETECNDFVYFTQAFDWSYENIPSGANMTLEYAVYQTQDFYNEIYAGLWFRIHVFMIDSSDNWWQVYESHPPYMNDTNTYKIRFSYFAIFEAWGGMRENENGTQEDPFDRLTVAVCLSPLIDFETRTTPTAPYLHPWMNATGSVSVIFDTLSLEILLDSDTDTRVYLNPTYNGTWTKPTYLEDLVIADDGSAYTVGRISSYEEQAICLTISKWSAQATLEWSKTWNGTNGAWGYGVDYYQDYAYVVGEVWTGDWDEDVDIVLLKLDTSGNIIWTKKWNTNGVSMARDIAITSDGSIYVGGWSGYREPYIWPTTAQVIKFDSSGNYVWNKTIGDDWGYLGGDYSHWDGVYQIEADSNDALFVRTLHYIMKLDSNGVVQWNYTTSSYNPFALTPDGGCVIMEENWIYNYKEVVIEKINTSGEFEWNQTYIHHLAGTWNDQIEGRDIVVDSDGTINAIIVANYFEDIPLVLTYDAEGNYVGKGFLDFEGSLWGYCYRIEVSQSNQIYIAYGADRQALMIFGEATSTGFDMMTVGLMVGGGAIAVVVIVIIVKKIR